MEERILQLKKRAQEIDAELSKPEVVTNPSKLRALTIEQSELSEVLAYIAKYEAAKQTLEESLEIMADKSDTELAALAQSELAQHQEDLANITETLKIALLPKDPNNSKNALLEIRGGAGGDEAALFAASLFRMYTRYAETSGFKVTTIQKNETGIGGYKEVIAEITGPGAYGALKYESGVHRVQRIPDTEKNGRVHTSTVTVVVLPEVEDVEIAIKPEELRVDVYRSGGHGGQSVNTTDSAVRITHLPTGIVVTCQNERSQLKNKEQAMKVLKTRLFELKEEQRQKTEGSARKIQIGTGDRSEKIRTYNFPQDRITDHRIKLTVHGIEKVLDGNLTELLEALKTADQNVQMKQSA